MNIFGLSTLNIIIFGVIIIFVVLVTIYWSNKENNSEEVRQPKYYKKQFFFSYKEYEFMDILKKILEDNYPWKYDIFPKTRLADIFDVDKYSHHKQWDTNKIWAKHVDFLIVDSYTAYKPILAIELNGTSHDNEEQQKTDTFKEYLFDSNNINFLIIRNEDVEDENLFAWRIKEKLV